MFVLRFGFKLGFELRTRPNKRKLNLHSRTFRKQHVRVGRHFVINLSGDEKTDRNFRSENYTNNILITLSFVNKNPKVSVKCSSMFVVTVAHGFVRCGHSKRVFSQKLKSHFIKLLKKSKLFQKCLSAVTGYDKSPCYNVREFEKETLILLERRQHHGT